MKEGRKEGQGQGGSISVRASRPAAGQSVGRKLARAITDDDYKLSDMLARVLYTQGQNLARRHAYRFHGGIRECCPGERGQSC